MHVALNGWFLDRPDTGSGQYLIHLTEALKEIDPALRLTLIVPHGWEVDPPPGVDLHTVPLKGRGHWAKVRFEQALAPRAAASVGADLYHVPYWAAPLQSPVPVVVTIHDLIPLLLSAYRGGALARAYTALVSASARGVSAALADSDASRRDILAHLHLPPERVHAIPLAAAPRYQPEGDRAADAAVRKKYDLPREYVLYLGGYDVRKNVHTLLKAFTYVRDGYDIPLVLAGRPPQTVTPRFLDIPHYIEEMDLADAVQVIGWVDEDDKPALYRMASCFVYPSRYEGFGLPVLEALACGAPVVTTNVSSLPEVVGEAGFQVDPDDARGMGGAILATLVQEEVAANLRTRGPLHAAEFSWARTAEETLAIYERVCRER
jgi:glycosyltransferase involved in cell wall biosynthesis